MKLIQSTAIIGALTLVSRVLGLIRDTLMTKYLGAGPVTDAFITAIRIPNTFRRIFAEGAFNAAFVPLYARRIEEEGPDAADQFASEALAALLFTVSVIVVLFEITMPWALNIFGFGLDRGAVDASLPFPQNLSAYALAVICAQITMPYLLLISLTSMFSGVLNSRHHFAVAALAPVIFNIVQISVLGFMAYAGWSRSLLTVYLCIGMTLSGILQLSLVVWGCRHAGVSIRLRRPSITPGVRRLFVLGVPGMLAAGITHINITVSHSIATMKAGAASWLYYADRLYQLPLGMIGIAMGVALLPALSRRLRSGDEDGAKISLNRALEISAFLTLPAAAALAVMPEFLVGGLFERGAFLAGDTSATGLALRMFAFGLPAFVLIKVLTPAFFARENTKTPMIFAAISAGINLSLGFALFMTIGFWGLALATSVAGWVNAAMLTAALLRRGAFSPDRQLLTRLPRIIAASLLMGAFCYWLALRAAPLLGAGLMQNYAVLIGVSGAGLGVYALAALLMRAYGASDIRYALKR